MDANTEIVAQVEPTVLGYSHLDAGLNNQKLALFGLFLLAREKRVPVVLPEFCVFNPVDGVHGRVFLDSVFSEKEVRRFAQAWGIEVLSSAPVETIYPWDCYSAGASQIVAHGARGIAALDDVGAQFFRRMLPRLTGSEALRTLRAAVFADQAIPLVVHLRIEKDWETFSAARLAPILDPGEDYHPSFLHIMRKIRNGLGDDADAAYVACDEDDLPVSKDEIRAAVMESCGVRLIWKSDVLGRGELAALSNLDRSILDFEMAVRAPIFVGLTRSTFSAMVSFEALCRTREPASRHYIYNLPGDRLGWRSDNGAFQFPLAAINGLHLREALAPPSPDDIHWRASLTAHIGSFGDFTSDAAPIVGVYGGALVAGCRFAGDAKVIEGFSLVSGLGSLSLEYRAKLEDGSWTKWMPSGTFVGTRGQSRVLRGFAVRLTGPLALSFHALCIGSFVGEPDLVYAGPEEDCVTEAPRKLEAMQIVFRRL